MGIEAADGTTKLGAINLKMEVIIPIEHTFLYPMEDNKYIVGQKSDGTSTLYDLTGKMVLKPAAERPVFAWKDKLFICYDKQSEKVCVKDTSGKILIADADDGPKPNDKASNIILIKDGNMLGFDINGQQILMRLPANMLGVSGQIIEGKMLVKNTVTGKLGYTDATGKLVIPATFGAADDFSDGRAWVQNKSFALEAIDESGKIVTKEAYYAAHDFKNGYAIVRKGSGDEASYGVIDKNGAVKTPLKYKSVSTSIQGSYFMQNADTIDVYDKDCKLIFSAKGDKCYEQKDGDTTYYNIVQKDSSAVLVDAKGKPVFNKGNNFEAVMSGGKFLIATTPYAYKIVDKNAQPVYDNVLPSIAGFDETGVYYVENDKLYCLPLDQTAANLPNTKPKTALAGGSAFFISGVSTAPQTYLIEDNNYFKLRDFAALVSGSAKQFGVKWNGDTGTIELQSGEGYAKLDSDLAPLVKGEKQALRSAAKVVKDGKAVEVAAYTIDDNNYFKLRDLAKMFNIGVTYDGATGTVGIEISEPYTE